MYITISWLPRVIEFTSLDSVENHKPYRECCTSIDKNTKYKLFRPFRWTNANKETISCVKCHPLEELVSTGDTKGRIFMCREVFNANKQPQTVSYCPISISGEVFTATTNHLCSVSITGTPLASPHWRSPSRAAISIRAATNRCSCAGISVNRTRRISCRVSPVPSCM